MRGLNRRGQFYLVAAVVILIVFGGFIAISNSVSYVQNPHILDLKNEIRNEASAIIDYGAYNNIAGSETEGQLVNLSRYYINNTPYSNLYFLLGTTSNITLIAYQTYTESVNLTGVDGGGSIPLQKKTIYQQSFTPAGNSIDIKINETDHNFTIKEGENFYFVISSFANGQEYVISS